MEIILVAIVVWAIACLLAGVAVGAFVNWCRGR